MLSLYTKHLCNPDLPDDIKASLITGLQKLACGHVICNETMATGISKVLKVKQSAIIKQVKLHYENLPMQCTYFSLTIKIEIYH